MMPSEAMGLWHSSFGAVKIDLDAQSGPGRLMGIWLYERNDQHVLGQEVIGFFAGALQGNVLELEWHEPAEPESLVGAGYLVFDPGGGRFTGEWWTHDRTRGGTWSGWRPSAAEPADPSYGGYDGYGQQGGEREGDPATLGADDWSRY